MNVQPLHFLSIAARDGVNMIAPDGRMSWYEGPTLIRALDDLEQPAPPATRLFGMNVFHASTTAVATISGTLEHRPRS